MHSMFKTIKHDYKSWYLSWPFNLTQWVGSPPCPPWLSFWSCWVSVRGERRGGLRISAGETCRMWLDTSALQTLICVCAWGCLCVSEWYCIHCYYTSARSRSRAHKTTQTNTHREALIKKKPLLETQLLDLSFYIRGWPVCWFVCFWTPLLHSIYENKTVLLEETVAPESDEVEDNIN